MPDSITEFSINRDEFIWKKERGLFFQNDASAIVLWDLAIEILLQTLDEHVDIEKSNTILKDFGFRMGALVSKYYSERMDLEDILIQFSDIYRNAGWGNVKITKFSKEDRQVIIELHNSWEHRVFKAINKNQECIIMPNYWTGFMSELMKENLSYLITKKNQNGIDFSEIHLFVKE